MPTTTELTHTYLNEHRSIKDCLQKGVVNYSALARIIAKAHAIEKKTSREAIVVAIRRYKEKQGNKNAEEDIRTLFSTTNIDNKNNILIYTIDKTSYPDALVEIEKNIKKEKDLFFAVEGTKTITIIIQQKNSKHIEQRFKHNILRKKEKLSLITLTTPGIEQTPGAVYHLTGLFFEQAINIEEFLSCYQDTLIVVESEHIPKVMQFLKF